MTAHPLIGEVEGTDLSSRMAAPAAGDLPGGWRAPFDMLEQGVPMAMRAAMGSTGRARTPADADVSILRSKITMPARPDWAVPRPRLDRLIADGVRGPLTALMGPPGMGKTLAMASWAGNQSSSPVAWVTLDEFDNRPRVLWSYVMTALRRAGVAVPHASWSAACVDTMDHEFLVRLAAALAAAEPPVILVLDDLHLLTERPALQGLTYLMRNAPQGLRVMVASRIDPLLPLHRFRLTGELTEIRADQLAFSAPEADLLMAQHDVALPREALECLTARAEGWAAGLRLAAISMQGHPDPEQFVKEFVAEDSPVVGYLVEEVLNAQPPGIRDLLLRTSILGSFDTRIASELSDGHAGSDVSDLVRANAFVLPAGSGWYRYHALFAEVLRLKLRHESPDLVPELHRRAAGWYRRHGLLTQAVRHAAASGDWQLAARIVVGELAVGQLIQPGGITRWPTSSCGCAPPRAGPGRSRSSSRRRWRWLRISPAAPGLPPRRACSAGCRPRKPPPRAWPPHRSGWPCPAAPGTWAPWPPRRPRPRPCWRRCPPKWWRGAPG